MLFKLNTPINKTTNYTVECRLKKINWQLWCSKFKYYLRGVHTQIMKMTSQSGHTRSRIFYKTDINLTFSPHFLLSYRTPHLLRAKSNYFFLYILASGLVSYRCAGTVISDKYVVTASHCVTNLVDDLELYVPIRER